MRNKKREIIINIIFTIYIIISLFIYIYLNKNLLESNFNSFLNILGIYLKNNISIIILFILYKYLRIKEYKDQLSKIDIKNNGDYYREILKGYSPFLISYIDDFKFNKKKDAIATILNLELKNRVKIENDKIYVINNDEKDLEESEKYLLKGIIGGKIHIFDEYYLGNLIEKDAIKKGLIKYTKLEEQEEYIKKKEKRKKIIIWIVIILLILSIGEYIIFDDVQILFLTFLAMGVIIVAVCLNPIFWIIFFIINKYYKTKDKIVRTKKGEEINIKLEGLKNYLKDYGRLEEKKHKEIIIWEEYLIYSVLFDKNNKLLKKLKKLF